MKKGMPTENWIDYWNKDSIFRPLMKSSAGFFIEKTQPILGYNKNDILLDYGCGPGFLEQHLKDRIAEIHGVDTALAMIAECRRKFASRDSLAFYELDQSNYTDLSFLPRHHYTKIICLSVIQYFRKIEDVASLIRNIQRVAAPGALFLIADIPVRSNIIFDTGALLKTARSEKIIGKALKFLIQSRFSEYYKMRSSKGLLNISHEALEQIINHMNLNAELINVPLTYNHRRTHLLIRIR